jgi:hypothetical protein
MPQGPIATQNVLNPALKRTLNITTATVVKLGPGVLFSAVVVVVGSTAGTVNDVATTGAAAAANQLLTLPVALGAVSMGSQGFPFTSGLVIVPGTGQTIVVAFQ